MNMRLGAPLSDHMVLQQGPTHRIWGWDDPETDIVVRVYRDEALVAGASARTGADGAWTVMLPSVPVGGPYRMEIQGSGTQRIEDVLVGEVWLASGQSNMELPLGGVERADEHVAAAKLPALRFLKVPKRFSREPEQSAVAQWCVCDPEHATDFTAVGFFFAKEIQARLQSPVGVIDASWGGTDIEAWISQEALRSVKPSTIEELRRLEEDARDEDRIRREYTERVGEWEKQSFPADLDNEGEAKGWHELHHSTDDWEEMALPTMWQRQGLKFNGVVWFRFEFALEEPVSEDAILHLGAIDDFDHTYVNGIAVGAHPAGTPFAFEIEREYTVPHGLLKVGVNQIAVRVFDHFGEGGFVGPRQKMFLEIRGPKPARIELGGKWRYRVEREIPLVPIEIFSTFPQAPLLLAQQNAPGRLFNGMIAPLLPYAIRGALWYQGENNAERYRDYRKLMLALIRDWRARWGLGTFPFYYVQLAAFRASGVWPWLREAQTDALCEPRTGMATAIDIGDPLDIHPKNKQDVGRRLALLAQAHDYGVGVVCVGPTFSRLERAMGRFVVHFRDGAGLRTSDGAEEALGFELAAEDGRFVPASARIRADASVEVWSDALEAACFLRYAWQDSPTLNLVNEAGLPALPFRTDSFAPPNAEAG